MSQHAEHLVPFGSGARDNGRLVPLGVMNIRDRTGEAPDGVGRRAFIASFASGEAVKHFLEPSSKPSIPI